jgi:hypothetical protein
MTARKLLARCVLIFGLLTGIQLIGPLHHSVHADTSPRPQTVIHR